MKLSSYKDAPASCMTFRRLSCSENNVHVRVHEMSIADDTKICFKERLCRVSIDAARRVKKWTQN